MLGFGGLSRKLEGKKLGDSVQLALESFYYLIPHD